MGSRGAGKRGAIALEKGRPTAAERASAAAALSGAAAGRSYLLGRGSGALNLDGGGHRGCRQLLPGGRWFIIGLEQRSCTTTTTTAQQHHQEQQLGLGATRCCWLFLIIGCIPKHASEIAALLLLLTAALTPARRWRPQRPLDLPREEPLLLKILPDQRSHLLRRLQHAVLLRHLRRRTGRGELGEGAPEVSRAERRLLPRLFPRPVVGEPQRGAGGRKAWGAAEQDCGRKGGRHAPR